MVKNKVALVFIGTGKYINFFEEWKKHVDQYFLPGVDKKVFVFSDSEVTGDDIIFTKVENYGWPWATLYRFKMMLKVKDELSKFNHIFYIDSDLHPRSEILSQELITEKPLVGVHHPGNFVNKGWYTWEDNEKSTAFVGGSLSDYGPRAVYFQGCLWGGSSKEVIELCEAIDQSIDKDLELELVAKWHDESHLNRYFLTNIDDVHILPFNYAFPEQKEYEHLKKDHTVKMLHISKSHDEFEYGIAYADNKGTT